jgi:hypothetical protein
MSTEGWRVIQPHRVPDSGWQDSCVVIVCQCGDVVRIYDNYDTTCDTCGREYRLVSHVEMREKEDQA